MKAIRLVSAIRKMGGTAEIRTETVEYGARAGAVTKKVVGELNGNDILMRLDHYDGFEGKDYFTVRSIEKRGYYDPGADYNSGDWTFCNRIKDLEWAAGARGEA